MSEHETLITSIEENVGTITINRPDSRNSLNTQGYKRVPAPPPVRPPTLAHE